MAYRKFRGNRKTYAIHRAGVAMDRVIAATMPETKRQAARWARAWFAAGGSPSVAKMSRKVHAHRSLLDPQLDARV